MKTAMGILVMALVGCGPECLTIEGQNVRAEDVCVPLACDDGTESGWGGCYSSSGVPPLVLDIDGGRARLLIAGGGHHPDPPPTHTCTTELDVGACAEGLVLDCEPVSGGALVPSDLEHLPISVTLDVDRYALNVRDMPPEWRGALHVVAPECEGTAEGVSVFRSPL